MTKEIALVSGYCPSGMRALAHRYNDEGPQGLGDRRPGGACLLSPEQQAQFHQALAEPPADSGLWTGPKVACHRPASPPIALCLQVCATGYRTDGGGLRPSGLADGFTLALAQFAQAVSEALWRTKGKGLYLEFYLSEAFLSDTLLHKVRDGTRYKALS